MPENFSLPELLALLSGVGYALLVVRRNRWAWAFGAVSSSLLTFLAARNGLPLQSVLQGVYVFMAGYGFWHWSSAATSAGAERITIARWPWGWHVIALVLALAISQAFAPLLERYTDAAWPRLDAFVTLLSLLATWMTARAVLENWMYWLLVDALSFYLYASQGLTFVAVLYVLYFLIAIWGLRSWWVQHRSDCILPSGGHNRLTRSNHWWGERVRREWADEETAQLLGVQIEVELAAQRLAANHGLAPKVLRVDLPRRRYWMDYVPGKSLDERWIEQSSERMHMWQLLERLRGIEATELPVIDLAGRTLELHRRLAELEPARARAREAELANTLAEWRAAGCDRTAELCLVHGDLAPANLRVTAAGEWRLIDWEYAHRGHPHEDLAGLIVCSEAVSGRPANLDRWRSEYLPPHALSEAQWQALAARVALRRLLDALWSDVAGAAGRRSGIWHPQGPTGKL